MAVFERIVSQARRHCFSSSLIRSCSFHRSFCSSSSSPKPVPISSHQEPACLEQSEWNVQNTQPLDKTHEAWSREFRVAPLPEAERTNEEMDAEIEADHRVLRRVEEQKVSFPTLIKVEQPQNTKGQKISFAAKETELMEWKGDILAVGVTEKDMTKDENSKFLNSILRKLDSQLHGLLSEISTEEDFTGKAGQSTGIRIAGLGYKRVNLIGLGKVPIRSATFAYCNLGESVASAAKASQANNVAIALASSDDLTHEMKLATASAIAKGTLLGTYEDNIFKSKSKKPTLKFVDFFGLGGGPELEKKLKYTEDVCAGIILGKELANAPAILSSEAEKIASTYSDVLTAKSLDSEQRKDLKMGSYLCVAAASTNPPKFIHLCYKPLNGSIKTKLAIVGKGLTFDSGGYNIKTGANCSIEMIKVDKGGSAAVLGAAKALGQIKPAGVEVHFIVASGTGMRLGDILTASNGKTIEVNITDAAGRLTLADALVYACNQGVDKIVDLATMTGACSVALGPYIAGIFTPSDELSKEVVAASEVAGESLCRLPMVECYWAKMKSGVPYVVNTDGHDGGSITAALFLKQFVDDKVQWLHIDMAGPVWNDEKKAATGFGIATLVEWVLSNSSS